MNRCLAYKILGLVFFSFSALTWAQSQVSVGELSLPSMKSIRRYISPELFYTHDFVSNTGGLKAGPRNIGALDIYLESDFSKFSKIQGETMIHFTHINSNDERGAIGDSQFASNIDMPSQIDRFTDLYYQHYWSDELATLLGIHDISMEFNVTPISLNFLNSSFGTDAAFMMSGPSGPSIYPLSTVGFRARYKFNEKIDLLAGVYDGDPGSRDTWRSVDTKMGNQEGYLALSEISHTDENHKYGVGGWNLTRAQEKQEADSGKAAAFGGYAMGEEKVATSTWIFARAGWANPIVNAIQSNIVTGVVQRGIFQRKKSEDEAGLGLTRAYFSRGFRKENQTTASAETAYEVYYQFRPMKILSLRPDLQYISNPSGTDKNDAWATAFRTVVEI